MYHHEISDSGQREKSYEIMKREFVKSNLKRIYKQFEKKKSWNYNYCQFLYRKT